MANDFFSPGWNYFIALISVGGILACLLLLWLTGYGQTNAKGTGHVWDEDLQEYNNPMPRWWVVLFILTIFFSLGYLYYYPGTTVYEGSGKWTSVNQLQADIRTARAEEARVYAKFQGQTAEQLQQNPSAMATAERLFLNNCAQCHGSDARGGVSFPNLTDKDWLWGGDLATIMTTITKGRVGMMPPQAEALGSPEDARNVAHYVLSLSGTPHDSVRAGLGKPKFAVCAACHGADGKGNVALGAPNLTDNVWLYGYRGEDGIIERINKGSNNQMPAQEGRLSPAQIGLLASYVQGLSTTQNQ